MKLQNTFITCTTSQSRVWRRRRKNIFTGVSPHIYTTIQHDLISVTWIRIRITHIQLTFNADHAPCTEAMRQWWVANFVYHLYYISIQHDLISLTWIRIRITHIWLTLQTMLLALRQWYKMHCSYWSCIALLFSFTHCTLTCVPECFCITLY
jgi:hypothetical protein